MKKSLSYVLPIAALLVIAVLVFRWLSAKPELPSGEISSSAEGIEISDLTGENTNNSGVAETERVNLVQPNPDASTTPVKGEMRYGIDQQDGSTQFTVTADLPELTPEEGFYQLWFEGEKGRKKAMKLQVGKGGFMGEGVLTAEFNQVKVIVSQEKVDDDTLEKVLLEGVVDLKNKE